MSPHSQHHFFPEEDLSFLYSFMSLLWDLLSPLVLEINEEDEVLILGSGNVPSNWLWVLYDSSLSFAGRGELGPLLQISLLLERMILGEASWGIILLRTAQVSQAAPDQRRLLFLSAHPVPL